MGSRVRRDKRECVTWRRISTLMEAQMVYRIAFSLLALAVAIGCGGKDATSPVGNASVPGSATSSSGSDGVRGGTLHLTKECSQYTGMAGSFCTITVSNLNEIPVGTREFALKDADLVAGTLNSDGVLYARDGELALNHCDIFDFFATKGVIGSCTFSGGIGHLRGFHAKVVVSVNKNDPNKADFDGTYRFSTNDDDD